MLRQSISHHHQIYLVENVQALEDNFCQNVLEEFTAGKWMVRKPKLKDIFPIGSTINWSNFNSKAHNKMLTSISER